MLDKIKELGIQITGNDEYYKMRMAKLLIENNLTEKLLNINIKKSNFFASGGSMDWLIGDWVVLTPSRKYLLKERGRKFYITQINADTLTQEMKDHWPLKTETGQLILPLFESEYDHENFFKIFIEPLVDYIPSYNKYNSWALIANENIFPLGFFDKNLYKKEFEKIIKKIKY